MGVATADEPVQLFSNELPLSKLDIVPEKDLPKSITLFIEARKVKFTDNGPVSSEINAWRYIRCGSKEEGESTLEAALGPILNVRRGKPLTVRWVNTLGADTGGHSHGCQMVAAVQPDQGPTQEMPPIDAIPMSFPEPQWAKMNDSVGIVTHLHGGKVHPDSDGWPLEPAGFQGNPYGFPSIRTYTYPNDQRAAMLWFHDHAMDNTSAQVHAGLAGLYFIRDDSDDKIFELIGGRDQEIPLVIQDRCLKPNGMGVSYCAGVPIDSASNTFIRPEFLGTTILVNGRPWPFYELGRKIYRLRILNGSNARTYALALARDTGSPIAAGDKVWYSDCMTVIGNDGGLFAQSHTLAATGYILLAPGERLDVLMDLTQAPVEACNLNLINLAVASSTQGEDPEAIFQNDANSVLTPPNQADDRQYLSNLDSHNRSKILQFRLCAPIAGGSENPLDIEKLNKYLVQYANDVELNSGEGFIWSGESLSHPEDAKPCRNRLILLMNDTRGYVKAGKNCAEWKPTPEAGGPWRDTQIWEMAPAQQGVADFSIPFSVDLDPGIVNPATGAVAAATAYSVSRSSFFTQYPASRTIEQLTPQGMPGSYDTLFAGQVIQPAAGTWERWYVANVGNQQPLTATTTAVCTKDQNPKFPDMHPFHMHLVNFVVQRRWVLNSDGTTSFIDVTSPTSPIFDTKVRHDTVRVHSNELVELLVYFPPGYTGIYPYHCHIVEHEDMGMMLNFMVKDNSSGTSYPA